MEVRIKHYLAQSRKLTGQVYLGVPHRLDRPASGVMVFAKDKTAARFLAEQFQRRQVGKLYWAIVGNTVNPLNGSWTDWMRKVPGEAKSEICGEHDSNAQTALLHYRTILNEEQLSVLQIRLETGRSHQIRLQAAHRGHALLGDSLYGSEVPFGPQTEDLRARWIGLHARQLEIRDPQTQTPLVIQAPLPTHWPSRLQAVLAATSSDVRD